MTKNNFNLISFFIYQEKILSTSLLFVNINTEKHWYQNEIIYKLHNFQRLEPRRRINRNSWIAAIAVAATYVKAAAKSTFLAP